MDQTALPLSGIRILDLTVMTAGPVGTMVLADMGANVIKVEEIGLGDLSRNLGTVFVAGESAQFLSQNRNKRSLRLDLKHPKGREAFLRLAAGCDVVTENFRPGTLDRLGVGYEAVRQVRPDIIFASVSAFGQDGPYAHLPANDPIVQALSGVMAMTGEAGSAPARIGNPYPDFGGAMLLGFGVVTALLHRMRTGQGQRISTSLLDGAVFSSIPRDGETLITGAAPPRLGSAHPTFVPYQSFRAQDGGWFFLSCFTEKFWRSLCEAIGDPSLRDDPRFARNRDRCAHRAVLIPLLEAEFARAPLAAWLDRLARHQVPAAPIQDLHQALRDDPQLKHNATLVVQQHPTAGRIETLAGPIRMAATPPSYRRPPPRLGEHSEEVLGEFGFTAEEIAALIESGAVRGMDQPDAGVTDAPLPTGAGAVAGTHRTRDTPAKAREETMPITSTRRTLLGAGGAALATGVLGRGARASWQPQRPIQIIVGFAAGGGTDVVARAIGTAGQEFFPVPLTIVNRPGAAGTAAAQMVARGPKDGTMLLVSGGSESTSVPNHQQLPYDPRTDFRGVIGIARLPIFLAVRGDSPIRTVGDFVTHAKANPGRVVFASAGVGGLYHSTMIVFGRKAGFEVRHVPYQGGAPALAALVGGHAEIAMGSPDEVASLAEAGTIRLIGVASRERITEGYGQVPTLIEAGHDVFIENMKGLSAPGGTPDEIVSYLHERFHRAMQTEQFKTLAARSGMLIGYSDGATYHNNIVTMFNIIGEALRQA